MDILNEIPPLRPRKSKPKSLPIVLKEMPLPTPRKSKNKPPPSDVHVIASTQSSLTSDGGDTILTDEQKEKVAREVTEDLCKYCKDVANEIIENQIREPLEDYIMSELLKRLEEKIKHEEKNLINID